MKCQLPVKPAVNEGFFLNNVMLNICFIFRLQQLQAFTNGLRHIIQ